MAKTNKEVSITFPEIQIQLIGKTHVLEEQHITTQDIDKTVKEQLQKIQQTLEQVMHRYQLAVKELYSLSVSMGQIFLQIRQSQPYLPGISISDPPTIKFNSILHKQLYKIYCGWRNHNKGADTLFFLGLIDVDLKLTEAGSIFLNNLQKMGPSNTIRNRIEIAKYLTLIEHKDSPIKHYLISNQFMLYTVSPLNKILSTGCTWLIDNASQLIGLKSTPVNVKVELIPFAPIDMLPEYLASENPKIRQAAKNRCASIMQTL